MNELITKISAYNIFNYLFPGTMFAIVTRDAIKYPVDQSDIIARLFLYYFVGLVISRIGSLLIEPALKKAKFVKYADYRNYVKASAKDPKLELLVEVNNTYRTLTALFGLLLIVEIFIRLKGWPLDWRRWEPSLMAGLLFAMFVFSYQKQTDYITKRVAANL